MNYQTWGTAAAASAVTALAVVGVYESQDRAAQARMGREAVAGLRPMEEAPETGRRDPAASASDHPVAQAGVAGAEGRLARQLERVESKLEVVRREKDSLEQNKRSLEGQLRELSSELAERDRYKYDLDQEDWKELAAKGQVRYRMPCLMPLDAA